MRRKFALLALVLLAGCDGYYGYEGRILAVDGKPIPGASVHFSKTISGKTWAADCTSDANGRYALGLVGSPFGKEPYTLTVSKNGFKTYTEAMKISSNAPRPKDISLERDDGQ